MKTFEYKEVSFTDLKVEHYPKFDVAKLNALGQQGWELVSAGGQCLFQREIVDVPREEECGEAKGPRHKKATDPIGNKQAKVENIKAELKQKFDELKKEQPLDWKDEFKILGLLLDDLSVTLPGVPSLTIKSTKK